MKLNEPDLVRAIVVGASSDIATELCKIWRARNWHVIGTYRNSSPSTEDLISCGVKLTECDLLNQESVDRASRWLSEEMPYWNVLMFAAGTMNPIGKFGDVNPGDWSASIAANVLNPLRLLHNLLPLRSKVSEFVPTVVFFAGAGTNNAPTNYSAYVISKLANIKITEILAAEYPDIKFVIVGPGWVKTKIHNETLKHSSQAGENLGRTVARLESKDWTSISEIAECLDWLFVTDPAIVSGRNFSVASKEWRHSELPSLLLEDTNNYKLRRHGNSIIEEL